MRIILSILFLISSLFSKGQVIKASVNYLPFITVSSCPLDITSWVGTTNRAESPTGTWGPASSPANGEAMANASIAGDGYIQAEYNSTANESTAIFLTQDESPTTPYYENVQYGLYVNSDGNYWSATGGSTYTDLSVAVSVGDLFRVVRTGTTIKGQYYRSGSWNDLVTYGTYAGTLWFGASSADPGTAKYLRNPKYCN